VPERLLRIGRWILSILILLFIVRTFRRNWSDLQAQPISWTFRPAPALAAVIVIELMYGMLIEAWRRMLSGWGQSLPLLDSARIWFVSSLGKYVPGKVWAIASMALMARDAGVAAWAATASAIILQALAVVTGAGVAALAGTRALQSTDPRLLPLFWATGAAGAIGVGLLFWRPAMRRLLDLAGAGSGSPSIGPVIFGAVANAVAWVGYGLALWMLAQAVLPESNLAPSLAIAAFAASYVAGLIALFAPGGLVVREGLLIALLQGSIGLGPATALAVASRVLLTITELGSAVPFLLMRRGRPSVA